MTLGAIECGSMSDGLARSRPRSMTIHRDYGGYPARRDVRPLHTCERQRVHTRVTQITRAGFEPASALHVQSCHLVTDSVTCRVRAPPNPWSNHTDQWPHCQRLRDLWRRGAGLPTSPPPVANPCDDRQSIRLLWVVTWSSNLFGSPSNFSCSRIHVSAQPAPRSSLHRPCWTATL